MTFDLTAARTRFQSLIAEAPISFTCSLVSGTGTATRTNTNTTDDFSDLGFYENYAFSIIADTSQFSSKPVPHQTLVTISGTEYRVLAVETDSKDIAYKIDLANKTR